MKALLLILAIALNADWTQYRQNAMNQGCTDESIGLSNFGEVFTKDLGGRIVASPVIKGDTLYVGTLKGKFYALDLTGKILWTYPASGAIGPIRGSAAIVGNLIIVGSEDSTIYAFNRSGTPAWTFKAANAVGADIKYNPYRNAIYIGDEEGYLYSLTPSGALNWSYIDTVWNGIRRSPCSYAVAADTTDIAMCYGNTKVYYLKDHGSRVDTLWTVYIHVKKDFSGPPSMHKNLIFTSNIGSEQNTGSNRISRDSGNLVGALGQYSEWFYHPPAVDSTLDFLYLSMVTMGYGIWNYGDGSRVKTFNPNFFINVNSPAGPAVASNGVVFTFNDGTLKVLDKTNGNTLASGIWSNAAEEWKRWSLSAPAISDGKVFFGADDGFLHCFGDAGPSAASAGVAAYGDEPVLKVSPNPANQSAQVYYRLPATAKVRIDVFNIKGEKLLTAVNRVSTKGSHSINLYDALSARKNLAAGMLVLRLTSGTVLLQRKVMVLK